MMSDAATIAERSKSLIGPGRLVLVVGPSGAGKDTLLRLTQAAFTSDDGIAFPRRMVTREASADEDNIFASPDEFQQTLAQGGFALHWEAHGHLYGVPRAIDDAIAAGHTVVVNVSRTIVARARQTYAAVTVVMITAPADIIAERLAARARPSDGATQDRLARSIDAGGIAPDVTISNVGIAADHAAQLVAVLRRS
jgi:ribose 1,5-bisphosphokinase